MRKWLIVTSSLMLLTGFNSFGPINQAEYAALARVELPIDAGQVLFAEPGAWTVNANGFADIRSQQSPMLGLLLLTSNGIYFQQWIEGEGRYDTMLAISVRDIASIRNENFGRSVRIVVKKKDLTVTSLSVMGGAGAMVDGDKTHRLFERLRQVRQEIH